MILQGKEINLDDISVNFKFGLNDLITLIFKIRNVSGSIRNINFEYKSSGMFSWEDQGVISCDINSPYSKIKWIVRETPNQPLRFELASTHAEISKFKINIEQAKHKILDKMATSMFSGAIRRRVQTEAENSLEKQGNQITNRVNEQFANLQQKVSSAATSAAQGVSSAAQGVTSAAQKVVGQGSGTTAPPLDKPLTVPSNVPSNVPLPTSQFANPNVI